MTSKTTLVHPGDMTIRMLLDLTELSPKRTLCEGRTNLAEHLTHRQRALSEVKLFTQNCDKLKTNTVQDDKNNTSCTTTFNSKSYLFMTHYSNSPWEFLSLLKCQNVYSRRHSNVMLKQKRLHDVVALLVFAQSGHLQSNITCHYIQ